MSSGDILKKAIQSLPAHELRDVEWVGFREVRETSTLRHCRDGRPELNASEVSHGVMAEALVQGQFGYASTPRLDPESLVAAAIRARSQALQASSRAVHRFSARERPPVLAQYASRVAQPLASRSAGELNELLIRICEKLRISDKIIRTAAWVNEVESEIRLASTHGSQAEQRLSFLSLHCQATAQDGSTVQKRRWGNDLQGGWELFLAEDRRDALWSGVRTTAEQALELLAAPECPEMKASLLLLPDQMMLQIHESIGHPLELDRILGDERNYAGWSFVRKEDFGTLQYGSPCMNVTFDPTPLTELASYGFDDTGNLARREYLIRDGILLRGLGGLESQARSGIPGVANGRACSWNRPPIDRMANLNLEPGESSLEQLIASVQRGVLMQTNRSWSIDDFRNKFQFGCEYARMIEDGRLTKVVRNPNYRGVTVPFWRSLRKVGDRSTFSIHGTPNCGKGEPNQGIRVGHASPACLFDQVEVFGGAS